MSREGIFRFINVLQLVALNTHKSIVYMATPIDQSSTATLPHIHTNVNPYVAHISFYLLQTAFFCFAFAVLFVLVIFMSV